MPVAKLKSGASDSLRTPRSDNPASSRNAVVELNRALLANSRVGLAGRRWLRVVLPLSSSLRCKE